MVGNDDFGTEMISNLKINRVDVSGVGRSISSASGCALITVDAAGSNSIVVVPGANFDFSPSHVALQADAIVAGSVLVCQLEIPVETTLAALRLAQANKVITLFNPAPAQRDLPPDIFRACDIICPNETEAEVLTGIVGDPVAAAKDLLQRGVGSVIVTLGASGALLVSHSDTVRIEAETVVAVDTSGAGDSLIGALACFLAERQPLEAALRAAVKVATKSVQSRGTQFSFPYRDTF